MITDPPYVHREDKLTAAERRQICEEYEAGASLNQLRRKYSVGYRTVRFHLLRYGVKLRPKGGHHR